jgi:hypothetical protein
MFRFWETSDFNPLKQLDYGHLRMRGMRQGGDKTGHSSFLSRWIASDKALYQSTNSLRFSWSGFSYDGSAWFER